MRLRQWIIGIAMLAAAAPVSAQGTATPSKRLGWTQQATTLAEAQAYTYKYYADAAATNTSAPATGTLTGVVCTGTVSPFNCDSDFPAFTPGQHTLTITTTNAAGESPRSPVLTFTFQVIPAAPGQPFVK